eukprot:270530_1
MEPKQNKLPIYKSKSRNKCRIILIVSAAILVLMPFIFFHFTDFMPNVYTTNIYYNNRHSKASKSKLLNKLHLNYTTFNLLTHAPDAIASLEENFKSTISTFMDVNKIRFVSY